MKILIVSKSGESLGLGQALVKEGHEVKFYIKAAGCQYAGLGIVDRRNSFRPFLSWADLIVSDSNGFGHLEKLIQSKEKPYIGFNTMADLLEMDRSRMLELFEHLQIPTPVTHIFDTPYIAEELALDWPPLGYIVKPVHINDGRSFTCKTVEECMYALSSYSGHVAVMAQRIIEGVEVSVQGWFNGESWVEPFLYTFEERRFLDGDRGANTISMGTVISPSYRDSSLVEILERMTPFLEKINYRGPIDLYATVNEDQPHIWAITTRFTYDTLEALIGLMDEGIGDFLYDVAVGKRTQVNLFKGYGMAVRLTIPPYPAPINSETHGRPLPINLQNDECFLLADCYKNRIMQTGGKGLFWAASSGVVAKAIGHSMSLRLLRKDIYSSISAVDFQDLHFRKDIGLRVGKDLKQLKKLGAV